MRSDASECPPEHSIDLGANTEHLQAAIRAECVGKDFEEGFPRYVWVWVDDQLYEARHMRGPTGTYKAYPLERVEYPDDPNGVLTNASSRTGSTDEP